MGELPKLRLFWEPRSQQSTTKIITPTRDRTEPSHPPSLRDIPCEASGKTLRNAPNISFRPTQNFTLFVIPGGAAPCANIMPSDRLSVIEQKRLIGIVRIDVNYAPPCLHEDSKHIHACRIQLLRKRRIQPAIRIDRHLAFYAGTRSSRSAQSRICTPEERKQHNDKPTKPSCESSATSPNGVIFQAATGNDKHHISCRNTQLGILRNSYRFGGHYISNHSQRIRTYDQDII
jgi:hypothetical protein